MADLGYRFPEYPVPPGETHDVVSAQARRSGRARALPAVSRSGPRADRARARSHRASRSGRLLPHRLGHRQFLPAERHPRAGTRVGRQQRRLLQPRDHGRRSGRHGSAVRAVSVGRARRVARHRSGSAERRSARARDSARLREIRAARRGDDGQRHHLSRPSAAREVGKTLGIDADAGRSAGEGDEPVRVRRSGRHAAASGWSMPAAMLDHPTFRLVRRSVAAHAGSAAASRAAFRRHGDLPGSARQRRAARKRQHARPRGRAVGQRRLRRHGPRESRSARPRHDGRAAGCDHARESTRPAAWSREPEPVVDLAHLAAGRSGRLPDAAAGRHHRRLPGGIARADGDAAAPASRAFLRSRRRRSRLSAPGRSSARWCIRI